VIVVFEDYLFQMSSVTFDPLLYSLTQFLHNFLQQNTVNCCISLQHYTKDLPLPNAKGAICFGSYFCRVTGLISFS